MLAVRLPCRLRLTPPTLQPACLHASLWSCRARNFRCIFQLKNYSVGVIPLEVSLSIGSFALEFLSWPFGIVPLELSHLKSPIGSFPVEFFKFFHWDEIGQISDFPHGIFSAKFSHWILIPNWNHPIGIIPNWNHPIGIVPLKFPVGICQLKLTHSNSHPEVFPLELSHWSCEFLIGIAPWEFSLWAAQRLK